jgi:hypothetical protein
VAAGDLQGPVHVGFRDELAEGLNRMCQPTWQRELLHRLLAARSPAVKPRVLIVDDERSMCELIEVDLRIRDFAPVWFTAAEEAFDAICREDYDVVLIIGESGTGKQLVARALHSRSRRRAKPFVAVNRRRSSSRGDYFVPVVITAGLVSSPSVLMTTFTASSIGSLKGTSIRSFWLRAGHDSATAFRPFQGASANRPIAFAPLRHTMTTLEDSRRT